MNDIIKLSGVLIIICVIAAGSLAFTFEKTKDAIAANKLKVEEKGRKIVLNEAENFSKKSLIFELNSKKYKYNIGFDKNGLPLGIVTKIAPLGFSGAITCLVGFYKNGNVSGIKVLSHTETPGLGAKVEEVKSGDKEAWFQKQFRKSLKKELFITKENGKIDSITAATISSKAITDGVRKRAEIAQKILKSDAFKNSKL